MKYTKALHERAFELSKSLPPATIEPLTSDAITYYIGRTSSNILFILRKVEDLESLPKFFNAPEYDWIQRMQTTHKAQPLFEP